MSRGRDGVRAVDVRSQILLVATRRFARNGFDGTSLQVIADEVGVRKPSLLHHFPSKAELQQAVLDNLFEHWNETLPRLLDAVTSGRDRFEAMTEELIGFFLRDPDRARLVVRQMMDRPEDMRARLSRKLGPWVRLIADYVRKSQATGVVRADVDPESYILHIVTLTVTAVASLPLLVDAIPRSEVEAPRPSEDGGRPPSSHQPPRRSDSDSVMSRHLQELKRIARSSLFEDVTPQPPAESGSA